MLLLRFNSVFDLYNCRYISAYFVPQYGSVFVACLWDVIESHVSWIISLRPNTVESHSSISAGNVAELRFLQYLDHGPTAIN